MAVPNAQLPTPNARTSDETIKDTFESIVIAFILAFVFRAYVVEAFVIPTGSMAPTLLGQHVEAGCVQCGYRWTFDASYAATVTDDLSVACPMCRYRNPVAAGAPTRAGDRLLVHKYIYQLAEPRRWDVVVFRNPQRSNADGTPGPQTNYIKRLVGLPGERLHLLDGNVYVAPGTWGPDATTRGEPPSETEAMFGREGWRIARKTDPSANRHWEAIQRAVWQPVYYSSYIPLDDGWRERSVRERWSCPWEPAPGGEAAWDMGSAEDGWRLGYRFDPAEQADAADNESGGTLRFNWRHYHGRGTDYPYNLPRNGRYVWEEPIEDVRLAVTVVPEEKGLTVDLATTARLGGEPQRLRAVLFEGVAIGLYRQPLELDPAHAPTRPTVTPLGEIHLANLTPGQPTTIELWYVDQEALVFVNGECVLRHAFDLPLDELMDRPAAPPTPEVTIHLAGPAATLYDVQLDRDLYYGVEQSSGGRYPHGALRRSGGNVVPAPPMLIAPAEFFVLGDNPPISEDSRFWSDIEPWVERDFLRPRTPTSPGEEPRPVGVVPRGLMVGRAFFVYYPAPYPLGPRGRQVLPNFGDMRFVR